MERLVSENNRRGLFEILETKPNTSFFLSSICSDRLKNNIKWNYFAQANSVSSLKKLVLNEYIC